MIIKNKWYNCYDVSWGKNIISKAYVHPAKFSRGLIERIYTHTVNMGWVRQGDWILDPFGGVALGGLDALSMGLNWVGIELEAKFVFLGQQNIELWNRQLKGWPNLGTARIIQGDSRRLGDMFCIDNNSSLNYNNEQEVSYENENINRRTLQDVPIGNVACRNRGKGRHNLGSCSIEVQAKRIQDENMEGIESISLKEKKKNSKISIRSRPLVMEGRKGPKATPKNEKGSLRDLQRKIESGDSPQRLRSLQRPTGEPSGSLRILSSQSPQTDLLGCNKTGQNSFKVKRSIGLEPIDLICSSPPYEESLKGTGLGIDFSKTKRDGDTTHWKTLSQGRQPQGFSKENLSQTSGDTFWSASKIILEQCFELLKPFGHAVFILKDYIKKGRRIPFSDRWLALCESVGFKLICRHQAMLVKEYGTQTTIHGDKKIITERKSFFRRLAESKGSPRIDWEDILCLVKEK